VETTKKLESSGSSLRREAKMPGRVVTHAPGFAHQPLNPVGAGGDDEHHNCSTVRSHPRVLRILPVYSVTHHLRCTAMLEFCKRFEYSIAVTIFQSEFHSPVCNSR
jgi:hypothetical protein